MQRMMTASCASPFWWRAVTVGSSFHPPLCRECDGKGMTPKKNIVSIQYLRAIAALSVVFYHAVQQLPAVAALSTSLFPDLKEPIGIFGVDIFFVISGFVMTYTTAVHGYGMRQFLARRLVRIVPLYWSVTIAASLVIVVAPEILRHSKFTINHLLLSLLFSPTSIRVGQIL